MKALKLSDFDNNEAWLIFRLDARVANEYLDIYIVMHLPSEFILSHEIVERDMFQQQSDHLFKQCALLGRLPSRVLLTSGDPAESFFRNSAATYAMTLETLPAPYLEKLISPVKKSFGEQFLSPSTIGHVSTDASEDDIESLKHFIPDSYDPCPCSSGKKYKFCCKKIMAEITFAMVAAEDGNKSEAIHWIEKAKKLVGESAEVLCREAIVYSFFDRKKSKDLLEKCLMINPHHPRAHYIRAIDLKDQGDVQGAISAYKTSISYYPDSDHFHLNEAYHNLGTALHDIGDLTGAKSAWEKALLHIPSDKMTQENLRDFIYEPEQKIF